jgi:hypothetical protein
VLFDVDQGYTFTTSIVKLEEQGRFVGEIYDGGIVLVPDANPQFTYALGRYSGIPGKNLLSQMYGPVYYYTEGDPFENWGTVGPQMWEWIRSSGVQLLVTNTSDRRFAPLIEEHPERLVDAGTVPQSGYHVYRVVSW